MESCAFVSADDRTLFVKGLADSVDEGKLQDFFSEASEVRLPQKDGYHRGYGTSFFLLFFLCIVWNVCVFCVKEERLFCVLVFEKLHLV